MGVGRSRSRHTTHYSLPTTHCSQRGTLSTAREEARPVTAQSPTIVLAKYGCRTSADISRRHARRLGEVVEGRKRERGRKKKREREGEGEGGGGGRTCVVYSWSSSDMAFAKLAPNRPHSCRWSMAVKNQEPRGGEL